VTIAEVAVGFHLEVADLGLNGGWVRD
jgi:hypothetical protein